LYRRGPDSGVPAHKSRKFDRGGRRPSKFVGAGPEQERNNRSCGVTDTLIDAVIQTNAGQGLAVIGWKQLFERSGAGRHSTCRIGSE
jgi:hypothetical protein